MERYGRKNREKLKDEVRERMRDRDSRSRQGICSRHGYLLDGYIVYIPGTHFTRGSARDTLPGLAVIIVINNST